MLSIVRIPYKNQPSLHNHGRQRPVGSLPPSCQMLRTVVDHYAATPVPLQQCRYSPSLLRWRVGCFISLSTIALCPICLSIFFRLFGTERGALRLILGIQRLHRNDLVGSRLFLSIDRSQVHTVLLNFEFTFMADGEKRRMLRVQRTNVVFHFVGPE